jgi:hypothetical protein
VVAREGSRITVNVVGAPRIAEAMIAAAHRMAFAMVFDRLKAPLRRSCSL